MPRAYLESGEGNFTLWNGDVIDGVRYPLNIVELWSADDLANVGLFIPQPADPVPDGKFMTGYTVERVSGVVKYVNTLADMVEPDQSLPTPVLYAAAQLQIVGGDITGIGINSRFAAAFWADVGKYYVFFLEPLPDTSYMVMATAGPCNAYVLEEDKATDFFIITVTNAAGEPTDASSVNISIVRAI